MATTIDLILVPEAFSSDPDWSVEQYHQEFVTSISAAITSNNVILGQVGGTTPTTNIGPWLNGTTLYAWNGSAYAPATLKVGGATHQVTLAASPTASRTINLPDKTGTLALTSDVVRATVTPALGPTVTIDWSLSSSFAIALDQDITIVNSNSLPGQKISINIYSPPSTHWLVTWGDVNFGVAGDPVQTSDNKTDMIWVENTAGTLYGRYLQAY